MTFSLCHASARMPNGWRPAAETWLKRCDNPASVEHILCVDYGAQVDWDPLFPISSLVFNESKRRGAAAPWNHAGKCATGDVLITIADDWHPCPHWDTELLKRIPNLQGEHAVWPRVGPENSLMFFNIVTRAYYERLIHEHNYDGFFHPGYIGMCADNDFTEVSVMLNRKQPDLIINAKDLFFQHFHPEYGTAPDDDVYRSQHRREAYDTGRALLAHRKAHGFKDPVKMYVGR